MAAPKIFFLSSYLIQYIYYFRVLAQVSCEVTQPKQIRPNEGILYINAEISPMAGPQFDGKSQSDLPVYLNRLLEKCYKDSKCLDLESLCIVVEEKVFMVQSSSHNFVQNT